MRHTNIIAEIGINHQNELSLAHALMDQALLAGADAVKFQASTVEEEVSFTAAPDHFAELGRLVPTWSFLMNCASYARGIGLEFICTPAGLTSLRFVDKQLGCQRLKISSDNLNNIEFLQAAAEAYADRPILLSTGMGTLLDVQRALSILSSGVVGRVDITVMHCTSAYPCPDDQVNLRAIWTMARRLFQPIGFSDHSQSTVIPAMAVALGATVIEKHLTLNRDWEGPDHRASLEPKDFRQMVENIRVAECALVGDGEKVPMPIEAQGRALYRKSLVARVPITAGEPFTADNLTAKRPGTGVPASEWGRYMGYVATCDYAADDLIRD